MAIRPRMSRGPCAPSAAFAKSTIEDAATVAAALDLAERGTGFADALHLGRSAGREAFLTFDRRFLKVAQFVGIDTVQEA